MVKVTSIEKGILCSEWPAHAIVSKASIEEETSKRQALTNEPHGLLVKLHGIKGITDDAWKIISGKNVQSITSALAILYDRKSGFYEHSKIMVDLRFLHDFAVVYPVKFFEDEGSALAWLRAFKKK